MLFTNTGISHRYIPKNSWIEMRVDGVGTPGRCNREKFRMHW